MIVLKDEKPQQSYITNIIVNVNNYNVKYKNKFFMIIFDKLINIAKVKLI